jgi:hypothetical protein
MARLVRNLQPHPPRCHRAVLCFIALSCALACRQWVETGSCPPCGDGARRDAARQSQLGAQWRSVAHEIGGPPALDFQCLCFGPGTSTSVEAGSINVPSDWALPEQTARAVHLALHRQQPPWPPESGTHCDARVERALTSEVDAHALELDTRRALGVAGTRYLFESDYFAAAPAQRRAGLRDYFLAHPRGDGVIPGFVSQYRARCP